MASKHPLHHRISNEKRVWIMEHECILWMHINIRRVIDDDLAIQRPQTIACDFSVGIHLDDSEFLIAAMSTQHIV